MFPSILDMLDKLSLSCDIPASGYLVCIIHKIINDSLFDVMKVNFFPQ